MHRQLWSDPYVGSYSVLLLLGFAAGYFWARRRSRASTIAPRHVDNLVLIFMAVGPLGARFFSRLFYLSPTDFWSPFRVWEGGGLVFYGGCIFGAASVAIYARLTRLRLGELADLLAPSLALGLAFGRIGCFLAGCCWGDLVSTGPEIRDPAIRAQVQTYPAITRNGFLPGVAFPPAAGAYKQHRKLGLIPDGAARSLPVHPVQLYEAAAALALAFWLHRRYGKRRWSGEIFCALVAGYAAIRFSLEFLRADNPLIYFGFSFSQMVSLLIGAAALLGFLGIRARPGQRAADRPRQFAGRALDEEVRL